MSNSIYAPGTNGGEVDFNLAALSGAISAPSFQNAGMHDSISSSSSAKPVGHIEAGNPSLAASIKDVECEMTCINNRVMAAILKGWSESLEREAEIVSLLKKSKVSIDPNSEAARIDKERNSAARLAEKAYLQQIESIDKGSDGNKVLLAAHYPAAVSLSGTNLDPRYPYLLGLKAMVDHAVSQLEQASIVSATPGVSESDPSATKKPKAQAEALVIAYVIMAGSVAIPVAPSSLAVESQVVLNAWQAITPAAMSEVTGAVTGWFAAMWGTGQLYQHASEKLEKYLGQKHSAQKDVDFAKTYAERIAGSLKSAEFNGLLLNLISQAIKHSPESQQKDPAHLSAMAKIALLSTALALLLKAEEGVANEWNFKGVLTGEVDVGKNDPYHSASIKRMLSQQIHDLLGSLPAQEREAILLNLVTYMSERPSVEKLLDQQKLFYETLNPPQTEKEIAYHQISGG